MKTSGEPLSGSKSVFWALTAFSLGSMAITLVGEAYKTRLIWYIRFADFVDLVLIAPLYLIALIALHNHFLSDRVPRRLRWAFLALAMTYLYGHAMHLTANAIDTFSTEIRDYRPLIPEDTYALIYFLDENLSHLIVFLVRYALFGCLLALEALYLPAGDRRRIRPAIAVGTIFGLWEAIVFVEGQKVWLALLLVLALGIAWLWLWRRSQSSLREYMQSGPLAAFVSALLPAILVGLVVYGMVTGGFAEPSEISQLVLPI